LAVLRWATVWYRRAPKVRRLRPIRAWEDVGVLIIESKRLEFLGRLNAFVVERPRVVGVNLRGVDTINPWVEVEGADGERAFFADGSRWGWGGARGGTEALAREIQSCLRDRESE
jgi:hypothetical protein